MLGVGDPFDPEQNIGGGVKYLSDLTDKYNGALAADQPWRFITTAFLHASPMHLAFNMWALWVLGSALEPVLGRWRFTALYMLSAVGGSAMIYWLAWPTTPSAWVGLTVGASGAVFGLFAALFIIQRRFGRDSLDRKSVV